MSEYTINSIKEYVDTICKLDTEMVRNGANKHEELLFRGQGNAEYELIPRIGRDRDFSCQITIFNEERNLIELAKNRLPDIFRNDLLPIELLALLQHYGIPTRLLDVTENALVALYFSCIGCPESDGEVIAFKNDNTDVTTYPIINAIADSYRLVRGSFCDLSLFCGSAINQPYFLEHKQMTDIAVSTNQAKSNWVKECCKKTIFVYAPIRSMRQQMQKGRFILFPNKIEERKEPEEDYFSDCLVAIDKSSECIAGRIIIPKSEKKKILYDLRLFGISKGAIFGDSVDIVCEEILNECECRINGNALSK